MAKTGRLVVVGFWLDSKRHVTRDSASWVLRSALPTSLPLHYSVSQASNRSIVCTQVMTLAIRYLYPLLDYTKSKLGSFLARLAHAQAGGPLSFQLYFFLRFLLLHLHR